MRRFSVSKTVLLIICPMYLRNQRRREVVKSVRKKAFVLVATKGYSHLPTRQSRKACYLLRCMSPFMALSEDHIGRRHVGS